MLHHHVVADSVPLRIVYVVDVCTLTSVQVVKKKI